MNEAYIDRYLNTDEPVLFETNSPILEKHYVDFNKFNFTKRNTATFAVNIILCVISIMGIIISLTEKDYVSAVVYVVCAVAIMMFPFVMFKKGAAPALNNGYHNGNINNYKFYQNCLINKDNFTISAIPYDIIVDAHETDEYFYLFISKVQAHIIPKNSFVYNTPQEMRKLLAMKLGNRFIVHCA